jgi:uncharacterized membrane protein (UPF0136 family)
MPTPHITGGDRSGFLGARQDGCRRGKACYDGTMLKPYLFIFGAIILAGGVQGLLAGSKASIIAAVPIAACVLIGAYLLDSKATVGLVLAGIGALAIAGRFLPAFLKAPDKAAALWPAGILAVLSIIAIVWIVVVFAKRT